MTKKLFLAAIKKDVDALKSASQRLKGMVGSMDPVIFFTAKLRADNIMAKLDVPPLTPTQMANDSKKSGGKV